MGTTIRPTRLAAMALSAAALALAAPPVAAQYNYGGGRGGGGGTGDRGMFAVLELGSANPRNTDNVVATDIASTYAPVIPSWDNDMAGRLGLGWSFASGPRIELTYWTFGTDTEASGSGSFAPAIGPPIFDGTDFVGDVIGFYSTKTEIDAATIDIGFGVEHELTDRVHLDWTLGLRHARFEETQDAVYDEGPSDLGFDSFAGSKSNESDMIGIRAGLRASYRFRRFSVGGGLAFSFLDGELKSSSGLVPTGASNSGLPSSAAVLDDDGRSGQIGEVEARVTWHQARDIVRVWAGWEEATWDGLAADPLRNFPGTVAPLADRDSITISSYKLGVHVRF